MIYDEEGLLGGTHFSIDGVELPSNASKENSGKFKELKEKKEHLEKKIKEVIREHTLHTLNHSRNSKTTPTVFAGAIKK